MLLAETIDAIMLYSRAQINNQHGYQPVFQQHVCYFLLGVLHVSLIALS